MSEQIRKQIEHVPLHDMAALAPGIVKAAGHESDPDYARVVSLFRGVPYPGSANDTYYSSLSGDLFALLVVLGQLRDRDPVLALKITHYIIDLFLETV